MKKALSAILALMLFISAVTITASALDRTVPFISALTSNYDKSIWPDDYNEVGDGCNVAAHASSFSGLFGFLFSPSRVIELNGAVYDYESHGNDYVYLGNPYALGREINLTLTRERDSDTYDLGTELLDAYLNRYLTYPEKYTAPIIRMGGRHGISHFIVITGKNADGSYSCVDSSYITCTRYVHTETIQAKYENKQTVYGNTQQIMQYELDTSKVMTFWDIPKPFETAVDGSLEHLFEVGENYIYASAKCSLVGIKASDIGAVGMYIFDQAGALVSTSQLTLSEANLSPLTDNQFAFRLLSDQNVLLSAGTEYSIIFYISHVNGVNEYFSPTVTVSTLPHSHVFGDWKQLDGARHSRSCISSGCAEVEYGEHVYSLAPMCDICGHTKTSYLIGDMNGDGYVDNADAIYLLYHAIFGENDYPLISEADFDKDGAVTNSDAIYLLYHAIFGEQYPLT